MHVLTFVWKTSDVVIVVVADVHNIFIFFFHFKNNTRPIILIKRFYFVYELDNECAHRIRLESYILYCLGDVGTRDVLLYVLCPKQAFTVK